MLHNLASTLEEVTFKSHLVDSTSTTEGFWRQDGMLMSSKGQMWSGQVRSGQLRASHVVWLPITVWSSQGLLSKRCEVGRLMSRALLLLYTSCSSLCHCVRKRWER
ncbi:hypothetical protein L6452_18759 [Arctium lappa]|uniref:Uncharacterized protein n=1 Tax=Arctium lappa TaxID=4217 RepID=A0ACB9C7E1_ARCLA|nr:hypothetical protein L6452_18759 [Arctium lappa]